MREGYVDLTIADHDLFNERFDDLPLVLGWQFRPPFVKRIGLVEHIGGGEFVDLQEVHFSLKLGQFNQKLVQSLFGGLVEVAKALGRYLLLQVELVCPRHFIPHLLDFTLVDVQQRALLGQIAVSFLQMAGDALRLAEKDLQFLSDNVFEVGNRYPVGALTAKVFRGIGRHIHLVAAGAEGEAAEEMHRHFAGLFPGLQLFFDNLVHLIPQVFGNDGVARCLAPFVLGLGFRSPSAGLAHGVEHIDALGAGFLQDAHNGSVAPDRAVPRAIPGGIQLLGDLSLAPVPQEQFIGFPADGGFFRLDEQPAVFPLIAVRRATIDGFAKLGAGQHRSIDALGDFLAFPLGEHAQEMKEHPTAGSAGVNGFAQGNEIGMMLVEKIGEILQFTAVARQPGQFGEDQAGDVAALDILHHPLGFGVLHDGLAALAGKVIDLLDLPAPALGVGAGALLVVLGALASGLVFGGNPNPDAHRFVKDKFVPHSTTSYQTPRKHGKNKVAKAATICFGATMRIRNSVGEKELAGLAKQFRKVSGQSKAEVARKLRVSAPSVFNAEERPELSLTGLRIRMIETYSPFKVVGPVFYLRKK